MSPATCWHQSFPANFTRAHAPTQTHHELSAHARRSNCKGAKRVADTCLIHMRGLKWGRCPRIPPTNSSKAPHTSPFPLNPGSRAEGRPTLAVGFPNDCDQLVTLALKARQRSVIDRAARPALTCHVHSGIGLGKSFVHLCTPRGASPRPATASRRVTELMLSALLISPNSRTSGHNIALRWLVLALRALQTTGRYSNFAELSVVAMRP